MRSSGGKGGMLIKLIVESFDARVPCERINVPRAVQNSFPMFAVAICIWGWKDASLFFAIAWFHAIRECGPFSASLVVWFMCSGAGFLREHHENIGPYQHILGKAAHQRNIAADSNVFRMSCSHQFSDKFLKVPLPHISFPKRCKP